jgi:hypothetical protein
MAEKSKTIGQSAYVIGITRTSIQSSIYKSFYTFLHKYVTDPNGRSKWWYPTYPEVDIDNGKLDYPIGVIEVEPVSWERLTQEKVWTMVNVTLTIYATSPKKLAELTDSIIPAVDNMRYAFMVVGVKNIKLTSHTADHIMRDKVNLHWADIQFNMRYSWADAL